jgi:hypothetical protein
VPRKTGTLQEQQNRIKREYKRGRKTDKVVRSADSMKDFELEAKKQVACFLKAADFSYSYMTDAIDVSKDVIRSWFADDEQMQTRTAAIQQDITDGAIKLLKTYAIELVEMLMEIAPHNER